MVRRDFDGLQFLLAHPGGPFFARRDDGVWSIPKGAVEAGEDNLTAALREFHEETGLTRPSGPFESLGEVRQAGGKIVHAWAFFGDCNPSRLSSNTVEVEWPRGSGRAQRFPEVDRFAFFDATDAVRKLVAAQAAFIERAAARLR